MYCSYCKHTNHIIDNCYFRQKDEKKVNENETESKSAYVLTSLTDSARRIIPTINITAPTDNLTVEANNIEHEHSPTLHSNYGDKIKNKQQIKRERKNKCYEHMPVSNIQSTVEKKIILNTLVTSCLYVPASAFDQHSKFQLDTGSPCSVLSNQIYSQVPKDENIQTKDDCTKLRAADGSLIETSGKVIVPLHIDDISFNQEFIIAKIHGTDGIIGMDFLCQYDRRINIKKQILKTNRGKTKVISTEL